MLRTTAPCEEPRLLAVEESATRADLVAEILELRSENMELSRALSSRAVIDQALGMVMVLGPCSSVRAWGLLVEVSQHCNVKLRQVAAALVATTEDEPLTGQLRGELRRALRHLNDRG